MIEFLTGSALATAAGLNAYVPLLALGLADRFLDGFALPPAWAWLSNDWVLVVLGILLVIELVADAIPAVDSVNDVIQTVVRPTAGGLAFGAGASAQTTLIADPAAFIQSNLWLPIVVGVLIALAIHVIKGLARLALNIATGGMAAPMISTGENVASIGLAVSAILLPVLALILMIGVIVTLVVVLRRRAVRRQQKSDST
jgi:hypothetical protein